jgi:Ca2+-transporting ATPase
MAKKNAIVRKLSSVETLGSTTVICTDKTGTLTKDEMTVTEIYAAGKQFHVTGSGYETTGKITLGEKQVQPEGELETLIHAGVHCNDAKIQEGELFGDPTEGALVILGEKVGVKQEWKRVEEIPFESERKLMSTLHETPSGKIQYTKGAPEAVLEKSSFYFEDGEEKKLTQKQKQELLDKNSEMARKALRVLGFAYKRTDKIGEKDLVFVGLTGMIDPPRPEVKNAIQTCKKAGIRVVMVTGDNKLTAMAIANQLGFETEKALTGKEVEKISDEKLRETVKEVGVFARVNPEHKYRVVKALQANGETVAVTGDGVNDAPALKMSDIGVAMGITGTDVSKGASDMVLRDDNFATIVSAVEEGRRIFDNIRNFIKYLLAANFDEIMVVGGAAIIGLKFSPYAAIQILWLNIATDGLPALALGNDPASPDIMERKPRPKDKGVFHGMIVFLLVTGLLNAFASATCFWYAVDFTTHPEDIPIPDWEYNEAGQAILVSAEEIVSNITPEQSAKAMTMAVTVSVLFELLFVFTCRSPHVSFSSNKYLIVAVLISLLLHLCLVYIPFLNPIFKTVPLGLQDWGVMLLLAPLAFIPAFLKLDKGIEA